MPPREPWPRLRPRRRTDTSHAACHLAPPFPSSPAAISRALELFRSHNASQSLPTRLGAPHPPPWPNGRRRSPSAILSLRPSPAQSEPMDGRATPRRSSLARRPSASPTRTPCPPEPEAPLRRVPCCFFSRAPRRQPSPPGDAPRSPELVGRSAVARGGRTRRRSPSGRSPPAASLDPEREEEEGQAGPARVDPASGPHLSARRGAPRWISGRAPGAKSFSPRESVLLDNALSITESVFFLFFGLECAFLSGKRISEKDAICFSARAPFVMIFFTDWSLIVKRSYLFTHNSK